MNSIEWFKGLPLEYESFLIERYDSYMTTCRYIEVYYPSFEINYMLVSNDGCLTDLLIFGNCGNSSTCLNSLTEIDQNIIDECSKKIFEKNPSIQRIKIDASFKEYFFKKALLYHKCNDHIINLPSTMDDYYLELGYHTRKNIKNRKVRLLRDFPKAKFVTKFGAEIDEFVIARIIELNRDRMKNKGIIPGKDDAEKDNIYKYSQHYGCVAYIEIDGVIVAGSISTVLNKNLFAHVIAHDNNFSVYHLGEICMFYLIQTAIEKGMSTFDLSWGENEYKMRLLAKPQLLFSYFIYRTYSLDYIVNKIGTKLSCSFLNIRLSKYSKPLRDIIKSYRKRKCNGNA